MSLNVTIPDTFDGPLDLLLHLIRRDEMDIYDIPIAKLANSYIEEMRKLEIVDVDEAAEFLDLASRLLEIKSRMLIPPEERADEEEDGDDDFDPRTGLVESLLEYRRFKDAARLLGDMAEEQARRYPRIAPRFEFGVVDGTTEEADVRDLVLAFNALAMRLLSNEDSNVITYTEVPTSVRIEQIETVLREAGRARFSLLLSSAPNRGEMVGFFIAMLEMVRRGKLIARQADNFSDIVLEPREEPAAADAPAFRRVRAVAAFPPAAPARRDGVPPRGIGEPIFPSARQLRNPGRKRTPGRLLFVRNCRC